MAKKVTVNVHAHHKDRDETRYLQAGDEVPDGFVVGDHATQEVREPEFVSVPGFGQVAVHELKRLQMEKNSGGLTDEQRNAQRSDDERRKAEAKSAKERSDARAKAEKDAADAKVKADAARAAEAAKAGKNS